MKKIVASLMAAFALVSAAPVFAQDQAQAPDPAASAAANELFEAMHYRTMMNGMMQQMTQGMEQTMRASAEAAIKSNPKTTPEQKKAALAKMEADLPAAVARVRGVLNDAGLVDEMMAEIVPFYARTYTADELKQITAFYRSPVGVKMMATMPQLMQTAMQVAQKVMVKRVQPMMEQMQAQPAGK